MNAPRALAILMPLVLAACAGTPPGGDRPAGGAAAGSSPPAGSLLHSSPECLAKNLKPGEPFPASAIPEAAAARRQSGSVAIRYDVIGGVAQNLVVVASAPPGLYDAAALEHAARYRDPTRTTVRGCVMTIDVRF